MGKIYVTRTSFLTSYAQTLKPGFHTVVIVAVQSATVADHMTRIEFPCSGNCRKLATDFSLIVNSSVATSRVFGSQYPIELYKDWNDTWKLNCEANMEADMQVNLQVIPVPYAI